jgi:hypothetical protein
MKFFVLSFLRLIHNLFRPPILSSIILMRGNNKRLIIIESSKPNVRASAQQLAKYIQHDCMIVELSMTRQFFYQRVVSQKNAVEFLHQVKSADEVYVSSPNSIFINYCDINISELNKIIFYQHGILNNGFLHGVEQLKLRYNNVLLAVWDFEEVEADVLFGSPQRYQEKSFNTMNFQEVKKTLAMSNEKIVFSSNSHSPEIDKNLALRLVLHLIINYWSMLVFCPHPDERWHNSLPLLVAKVVCCNFSSIDDVKGGILLSLPSTVLYDTGSRKFSKKLCVT